MTSLCVDERGGTHVRLSNGGCVLCGDRPDRPRPHGPPRPDVLAKTKHRVFTAEEKRSRSYRLGLAMPPRLLAAEEERLRSALDDDCEMAELERMADEIVLRRQREVALALSEEEQGSSGHYEAVDGWWPLAIAASTITGLVAALMVLL